MNIKFDKFIAMLKVRRHTLNRNMWPLAGHLSCMYNVTSRLCVRRDFVSLICIIPAPPLSYTVRSLVIIWTGYFASNLRTAKTVYLRWNGKETAIICFKIRYQHSPFKYISRRLNSPLADLIGLSTSQTSDTSYIWGYGGGGVT